MLKLSLTLPTNPSSRHPPRLLRCGGDAVVHRVAVAVVRAAVQAPDHLGTGTALHPAGHRHHDARSPAHRRHHPLARLLHLHACLRHHRRQLLSLLELLPAGALPGQLSTAQLPPPDRRGKLAGGCYRVLIFSLIFFRFLGLQGIIFEYNSLNFL